MRQTLALCLAGASVAAAGHVSVSVSRKSFSHPRVKLFRRQDDDGEPFALEALNNITGGGYYSDFDVGTPPQTISFLLDTGSSDTWVNSVDADLCTSNSLQSSLGFCETQFDQDESETFELVDRNGFDITYLDGRNIQGDYFEDTVSFGDIVVENQQLGLALESVRPTGIMGLGFSANVATTNTYATIIENLVEQGYINTPAFSLYLNDIETDAGNILFGGIDTKKFIGELAILPLTAEEAFGGRPGDITSFNVALNGFDLRNPDGERAVDLEDLDSFAILDSGSTLCLLPDDQVQDIYQEFDVLTFRGVTVPFVDCAWGGDKGEGYVFDFLFDNKTINVPLNEMVIDAFSDVQDVLTSDPTLRRYFEDWDSVCMFGISSTSDFGISTNQFTLLGATFLRSAYVVYDLANEQLAIAQANPDTDDEDIVEITAGALPDVTGVESESPTTRTTSTRTSTSSSTESTSEPSPTSNDDDDDADEATSTDATSNTETETDSGSGASNTDGGDEDNASPRLSAPMASIMGLLAVALILL